jgi:hypothetical protein
VPRRRVYELALAARQQADRPVAPEPG